ncbi:unnamed protein product, partial [Ixodes pacificus]
MYSALQHERSTGNAWPRRWLAGALRAILFCFRGRTLTRGSAKAQHAHQFVLSPRVSVLPSKLNGIARTPPPATASATRSQWVFHIAAHCT